MLQIELLLIVRHTLKLQLSGPIPHGVVLLLEGSLLLFLILHLLSVVLVSSRRIEISNRLFSRTIWTALVLIAFVSEDRVADFRWTFRQHAWGLVSRSLVLHGLHAFLESGTVDRVVNISGNTGEGIIRVNVMHWFIIVSGTYLWVLTCNSLMLNFLTYHYRLAPDGDQILNVVMRENIVVKVTLSVVKGGQDLLRKPRDSSRSI